MDTSFLLPRRILALEWDPREARVVVVRKRGGERVVEQAFAVDLRPRDAAQAAAQVNIGERIGAALSARGLNQLETLVAVGRANIELRKLSVPPAPAEELPDLVRFQAQRQFAGLSDDWPLDFVSLEPVGEANSVLAAAISPDLVAQVRATCQAAGQTPRRMVLRPFAAASLWQRSVDRSPGCCELMVDVLTEEADLTVLVDGAVVFLRTVRLGAELDDAVFVSQLAGEIRRTMGAAQNQLGGRRVERLVLCGDSAEHAAWKQEFAASLGIPIALFDPFAGLSLGPELAGRPPQHAGRFAPLLGLALTEANGLTPAIDFLHPRRRPLPQSQSRRWGLVGGAVAAVLLGAAWMAQSQLWALDRELASLTQRSKELDPVVKQAELKLKHARELAEWVESDFSWLDELHQLSRAAPNADELRLAEWQAVSRPGLEGQITLEGRCRDKNVHQTLVEALRNGSHKTLPAGGQESSEKDSRLVWQFKQAVLVKPTPALPAAAPAKGPQP